MRTLDDECDPDLAELTEFRGKICFELVPKMPVRSKENDSFVKVREETMGSDFKSSFLSREFSDISVKFRDESYPCHKIVLAARCEYFRRVLQSMQGTDREHEICIEPGDASKACTGSDFKAAMFYLYTGALPDEAEGLNFDPCHVLALAEQLGLPRLKELCEKIIAGACSCSRNTRNGRLLFDTPVEDYVRKNIKETIDAYINARRCNAQQLEQLLLFNICSNADLIKAHLDGCLRGAFGDDITTHESLNIIRDTVKLTSSTFGTVQTVKIGAYGTSTVNLDTEEMQELRLKHEAFREAVIDNAVFRKLCDSDAPDLEFRVGSYSEASEMQQAINRIVFPSAAKFFDPVDDDERDEDQFASALLSDYLRETDAELMCIKRRVELTRDLNSSEEESDRSSFTDSSLPTARSATLKAAKRIPSAYNEFMKTGTVSHCYVLTFAAVVFYVHFSRRDCQGQGSNTAAWSQRGIPASCSELAEGQNAAGGCCSCAGPCWLTRKCTRWSCSPKKSLIAIQ